MIMIRKDLKEAIIEQCRREFPNEACGMLAGKAGKVEKV